ncbi:MAG: Silent information regulator protein Sir2 [Bacteroidetes bacterium]|nr:Silent information regulator protein Sir2 [Bacteroidota bacterium]
MYNKKKLVVLTGAGMSVESGLSTFRGAGGMWGQHRVEDVATIEAWYRDKQKVLDFYNIRRKELLGVKPNLGHAVLVELEKDFDVKIITQNVDNLHEQAGSTHVLHLHGELMKVRSCGPGAEVYDLSPDNYETRLGDTCPKGYQLRPHIVWFGEAVPEMNIAIDIVEKADIFLIIGTSLQVYPAASLLRYVPAEVSVYMIDPNEVSANNREINIINKGAGEGMLELKEKLRKYL